MEFPRSKAQALVALKPLVRKFLVPDLMVITAGELDETPLSAVADRVEAYFGNIPLIIRSSASNEDGVAHSMAGAYDSVAGVMSDDPNGIASAVMKVKEGFLRLGDGDGRDEIIFQEYITDTVMSGVVFTHDLNTGAPYYVFNYDDVTGSTSTVTAGEGEYSNRTLYVHRNSYADLRSERFRVVVAAVKELEELLSNEFLDIEFAISSSLQPYLLQVRSITTKPNWNRAIAGSVNAELHGVARVLKHRLRPKPRVFGQKTVLAQMPDWNPAEMIGRAPRALAYSLYHTLITEDAWSRSRAEMGYSIPSGEPLMVSLAGQPFIDTRLSFHSFLPRNIDLDVGEKLVTRWVNRLSEHPELHDKVEFEIAITVYSFDIDHKLKALVDETLNDREAKNFKAALFRLTLPLLLGQGSGSIGSALSRIELLREKAKRFDANSGDVGLLAPMIHDCITFGTTPFATLARHGFIAQTLLRSLVTLEVITADDLELFQSSVQTVAGELVEDMRCLQGETSELDEFMAKYGHLRPGTYDIMSPRYDQMNDFASSSRQGLSAPLEKREFILRDAQRSRLVDVMAHSGLAEISPEDLLEYCRQAISGREYGKFVFTKSVSDMLELIAIFGESLGLSRDEMSHIPVEELRRLALESIPEDLEFHLRALAKKNAERHAVTSCIRLPQVLIDEASVYIVPFQVSTPNFITNKKFTADLKILQPGSEANNLDGKIVMIENADPGYDWIFSQKIGGLITKYGGANSHMAIRCAEFVIPAAIGCGEQRYEALMSERRVTLDCSSNLILPVH